MSGSGSGEERAWTVWIDRNGRIQDGSTMPRSTRELYCFKVVEASELEAENEALHIANENQQQTLRAEREAREKAEEALREVRGYFATRGSGGAHEWCQRIDAALAVPREDD